MVNFSTSNEGQWFYFDDKNPDLGGVCLREIPIDELRNIERISTKTGGRKFEDGKWVKDTEIDKDLQISLIYNYSIVDWKNMQLDGSEVECNTQNKKKAMRSTDFMKFVVACLSQLHDQNRALENEQLKNLEKSLDGGITKFPATSVD